MIYEHRSVRPISHVAFARRMARHGALVLFMTALSLGLGMAGYEYYEDLPWRDAFLNTAMILGGMGPVNAPQTHAGKIFAGLYALYSGLVFLLVAAVLIAPVVHRIFHHFHWEGKEE